MDEVDKKRYEEASRRYPLARVELWLNHEGVDVLRGVIHPSADAVVTYRQLIESVVIKGAPGAYIWKFVVEATVVAQGKFEIGGEDREQREWAQAEKMIHSAVATAGGHSADEWVFKVSRVLLGHDGSTSIEPPEEGGWVLDRWTITTNGEAFIALWRRPKERMKGSK